MRARAEVLDEMARPKRNDVSVKLDAEATRLAKIVAAFRDQTLAEYLSEIVLAQAKKDLDRHMRQERGRPAGEKGGEES
jgi:hypothetical protein